MNPQTKGPNPEPAQIVFLSSHDPLNVRAFSGTIYHMARALRDVLPEIEFVRATRPFWYARLQQAILRGTNGRSNPDYWRALNRLFARRLVRRWAGRRVLVIGVVSAPLNAELASRIPLINVSDATFALMRNFYDYFARFGERASLAADEIERLSILRSIHSSFSSRWAANSAVHDYGASEEQVSAISWGCNLPDVPTDEVRVGYSHHGICRLLFLGADWRRKAGDVVCEAGKILAGRGVPIRIDIAGARPPAEVIGLPWLEYHGFLSKADDEQFARLRTLIRDADFLFLPTRQDCTPMVFAEANAYGTPVVTRDVGGVSDVVRDGINGIVLPESAQAADFADAIQSIWKDQETYQALRSRSRREYEERLNWRIWAQSISAIIDDLSARGHF